MTTPTPSLPTKPEKRQAIVLVAVLLIVALLSLAAYQYCDMMTSEYKASYNAHRTLQARAFAESGIHYSAAMLTHHFYDQLQGNPWNNPDLFRDIKVTGDNGLVGKFSIIAPGDPEESGGIFYGVMDESAKINLNALMKLDATGELAFEVLLKLPGMTEEIAGNIVDWMDADSEVRGTGGAENDYYMGLTPPYRCKNGPLDSIDELLLVKGVTADLLYGTDYNRNNIEDEGEGRGDGFVRGWAAFLTVHSREQNYDTEGNMFLNLNNMDLKTLNAALVLELGEDHPLVKFIMLYRLKGPGSSQSLGSAIAALLGGSSSNNQNIIEGSLDEITIDPAQLELPANEKYKFASLIDLLTATYSKQVTKGKTKYTVVYRSPLASDPAMTKELLPKILGLATLTDDPELPARVNINTAPREVLMCIPGLEETDVEKIIATRPKMSSGEMTADASQTAAWLITEAVLDPAKMKNIDKYVTGRSQVFRVQSVGTFENKGPTIRVEAIVDTNMKGRPRIIAWRDLSELGKGIDTSMQK